MPVVRQLRAAFAAAAAALTRAVVLAMLLFGPLAHAALAQQSRDLGALQDEVAGLSRESANLDTAIERQAAENARIVTELDAATPLEVVRLDTLRQAQFEVDIARTRLLTLEHRLEEQARRLQTINDEIVRASAAVRPDGAATLAGVVEETTLEWLDRLRTGTADVLQKLVRYDMLSAEYLNLRQEELSILQSSIDLGSLEGLSAVEDRPVVRRLRALVDHLSQVALALTNEASRLAETDPAAVRRRNLLRLRADEALLRSNARLTDIAIVEARALLDGLQPLLDEPAIPVRLLDEALAALEETGERLARSGATVATNRSALRDFERILGDPPPPDEAAVALSVRLDELAALLDTQGRDITALNERFGAMRAAFAEERAQRERGALLERVVARTDKAARARISAELMQVPARLRAVYAGRLAEVRTALAVSSTGRIASFALCVVIVLALVAYLRQRLLRRFISAEGTRATEVPLEVLRRNLFWLFPVAVWALFTRFFSISSETALSILTLLAIPAAAALLRDLTQVIVSRRSDGSPKRLGRIITRLTEVAMVLTAVMVFAYVVLEEVSLLPTTRIAVNRLAYSVFVLSGLPMLLFVFVFAGRPTEHSGYGRLRRWIAGALSLVPPLVLIAVGVTGLAGFTRLAGVMMEELAVALAIAAALALALGILHDLVEGIAARLRAEDPARAYFVRTNLLLPLKRAGQVLLLILATIVAARLFGWTAATPGVREVVAMWTATLFTVGGTSYSVGSVVFAALAFAFVFWAGAWSRRVAYTVVFGRLKDIGIRQSLSVFAQYVVIVVGILLTLSAVGFDVTTLTVFAASLGVGIGFGLQNVVNNFISGLLLLVERPLRLGDIVTVGGNSGTVSQIGIRSMRLRTFDEFDLIVPNSALISDTFTNWTRSNSVMRVLLTVGVSYGNDPQEAADMVSQVLDEHPAVLPSPAPMVTVDDFADSSINLRVCYYIDLRGTTSGFTIRSQVLTTIWRRFGERGVSIPFPQRDVHIIAPAGGAPAPAAAPGRREDRASATREDWVGDAIESAGEASDGESSRE